METSAKANINVENVCSHSCMHYNMPNSSYNINTTVSFFGTGIFDTCQRHQIENGHKIGMKNPLK